MCLQQADWPSIIYRETQHCQELLPNSATFRARAAASSADEEMEDTMDYSPRSDFPSFDTGTWTTVQAEPQMAVLTPQHASSEHHHHHQLSSLNGHAIEVFPDANLGAAQAEQAHHPSDATTIAAHLRSSANGLGHCSAVYAVQPAIPYQQQSAGGQPVKVTVCTVPSAGDGQLGNTAQLHAQVII